jgi:hypothetical protein
MIMHVSGTRKRERKAVSNQHNGKKEERFVPSQRSSLLVLGLGRTYRNMRRFQNLFLSHRDLVVNGRGEHDFLEWERLVMDQRSQNALLSRDRQPVVHKRAAVALVVAAFALSTAGGGACQQEEEEEVLCVGLSCWTDLLAETS